MNDREKIIYITNLYSKLTFLEIYAKQITFVLLVTIFEIVIIIYFYLAKNREFYKKNWKDVRCNLNVIPFAGFINKPDDQTFVEYTEENYKYCTNKNLASSMNDSFEPIFQTQSIINNIMSVSNDIVAKTIAVANATTSDANGVVNDGVSIIYEIFNQLYYGFTLFMDVIHKLTEILYTTVNFIITSITWGTLFFKMLISAVLTLLIILFVTTVVVTLPIIWLWPPLIIYTFVFIFLLVIASSFQHTVYIIVDEVSKVEPFTSKIKPKLNLCFGENTRIKTKEGYKKIKDIRVGDVLSDSVVTATFKTIPSPNMFLLDKIVVSGDHFVKCGKWIKVKDHPRSKPYRHKKHLYCLNTTTKKIKIGDHEFLDWDDLTPKMKKRLGTPIESGFPPLFLIKMADGKSKPIVEIVPNDILNKNIRVVAVVCLNKKHHIVTDLGYFVNDEIYMDYNFNIDKILSNLIL